MIASGFSWFRLIPGIDQDEPIQALGITEHALVAGGEVPSTTTYVHAWLAAGLLIGLAVLARMALARAMSRPGLEKYYPSESPDALSVAEVFAQGIQGMIGSQLADPKDVRAFFPLVAGLFTYIFMNNIQAIFPGFLAATDNVSTNAGMALLVFLTFNYVGLSRDAVGYIKHLAGPALPLIPFMFALELLSLTIRPYSLTLRLAANMFGDHAVFTTVSGMIPFLLPVPLLGLAIIVSGMQSFVFSLLTVVYINLSLPHDHGHEGEHGHDGAHGNDGGHDGHAPAVPTPGAA